MQKPAGLARPYGLRRTIRRKAVRPILSVTGTHNYMYKLAKQFNEKLKTLSVNNETVR